MNHFTRTLLAGVVLSYHAWMTGLAHGAPMGVPTPTVGSPTASPTVETTGIPDLAVGMVRFKAPPTSPCDVLQMDVDVKNIGKHFAYVRTGSLVSVKPGFAYKGPSVGLYIQPGETKTFTLDSEPGWAAHPGPVALDVRVEADAKETQRANNSSKVKLVVPAFSAKAADLVVIAVQFEPPVPTTADRIRVDVKMANKGVGPAVFCSGDAEWSIHITGGPSSVGAAGQSFRVEPGAAFGAGANFVEPGDLKPGSYQAKVTVNPHKKILESNAANNTWSGILTVK